MPFQCLVSFQGNIYRELSNMRRTKSLNLSHCCSCLWPIHWSQVLSWEWRLIGASPVTSERSTILLPTLVRLILDVLRYLHKMWNMCSICLTFINKKILCESSHWFLDDSNKNLYIGWCPIPMYISNNVVGVKAVDSFCRESWYSCIIYCGLFVLHSDIARYSQLDTWPWPFRKHAR